MEIIKGEMVTTSAEIVQYMEDFATARGWNLEELPQIQFNAVCQAVGAHFFGDMTAQLYKNNRKAEGLDYNKVIYVYNLYVAICNLYNKIPSIVSLSYFLNIDSECLYNCIYQGTPGGGASSGALEIVKKLSKSREASLLDRALDKGGAVGVAIVGNYQYKWDKGGPVADNVAGSSVALPTFGGQNLIDGN